MTTSAQQLAFVLHSNWINSCLSFLERMVMAFQSASSKIVAASCSCSWCSLTSLLLNHESLQRIVSNRQSSFSSIWIIPSSSSSQISPSLTSIIVLCLSLTQMDLYDTLALTRTQNNLGVVMSIKNSVMNWFTIDCQSTTKAGKWTLWAQITSRKKSADAPLLAASLFIMWPKSKDIFPHIFLCDLKTKLISYLHGCLSKQSIG